jgi:hypothetical protein
MVGKVCEACQQPEPLPNQTLNCSPDILFRNDKIYPALQKNSAEKMPVWLRTEINRLLSQ